MNLHVLGNSDKLLVEPRFDPNRIGLIYLPDYTIDTEPQQGYVRGAGRYTSFRVGSYVLYHRFRSTVFWVGRSPRLILHDVDIVAEANPDTGVLTLRAHDVMVNPDWHSKYNPHKWSPVIEISQVELEDDSPVLEGTVEQIGNAVSTVLVGQRIVLPPYVGAEVGLITRNIYIIPEKEILATL